MGSYWETTKIFLSNISNDEIIPDENFPDYGMSILPIVELVTLASLQCIYHIFDNIITTYNTDSP